MGFLLLGMIGPWALPGALPEALAQSALAPALREYRVEPGETSCPRVAKKVFGDPKAVRLIHAYNRLGPQPHHLKPGQILRLPVSEKAPVPEGPDAYLTFVRNQVEAYTPRVHSGQKDEALVRGNRVSTLDASSAELTFRDDSRLQLGERTLVIVLGDESRKAEQRRTAETTLVEGELRAHLGALAGTSSPPKPLELRTAGGHRITIERGGAKGEAKLEVERDRLARLAVYEGRSRLGSRGRPRPGSGLRRRGPCRRRRCGSRSRSASCLSAKEASGRW
jgi:hypothetical protein